VPDPPTANTETGATDPDSDVQEEHTQVDPPLADVDDPPSALPPVDTGDTEETKNATPPATVTRTVSFASDVLPIFEERCYKCHGPRGKARGGLRLNDIAALMEGPQELWILQPGSAEESLLYQLITLPADDLDIMPASGDPLNAEQIDVIKRWIDEGAHVVGTRAGGGEIDATADEEELGEPKGAQAPAPKTDGAGELPETTEAADTEGLFLGDAQRTVRDKALADLRALGAYASRIAQTSDEVEVHFGLMGKVLEDGDLEQLRGLEACLVSLDLSRTSITDEGLAALVAFPRLRRLRLDQTAIGDAGLAHLATMRRLESLNLFKTRVGDDGIKGLRNLKSLRRLYLWQCDVSAEAMDELGQALPQLTIVGGESLDRRPEDSSKDE
jgi:hypothetical protein